MTPGDGAAMPRGPQGVTVATCGRRGRQGAGGLRRHGIYRRSEQIRWCR